MGDEPLRGLVEAHVTAQDPREVVADPQAPYSGAQVSERTLVRADGAPLGETHLADWLTTNLTPHH
jgi:hypothetical protein